MLCHSPTNLSQLSMASQMPLCLSQTQKLYSKRYLKICPDFHFDESHCRQCMRRLSAIGVRKQCSNQLNSSSVRSDNPLIRNYFYPMIFRKECIWMGLQSKGRIVLIFYIRLMNASLNSYHYERLKAFFYLSFQV